MASKVVFGFILTLALIGLVKSCGTYRGSISCGSLVSGTTSSSSTYPTSGSCGTSFGTRGKQWWRYYATPGTRVTATTCSYGGYDTKLWAFAQYSCNMLSNCLTGNDDACSLRSTISFTTSGWYTTIVVGGWSSSYGYYQLQITSCVSPISGTCTSPLGLSCGSSYSGSTTSNPVVSLCSQNSRGRVYRVYLSAGQQINTATCSGSSYDTRLTLGLSCTSCIGTNDDSCGLQSRYSYSTSSSRYVYVVVQGYSSSSYGTYGLQTSCTSSGFLCIFAFHQQGDLSFSCKPSHSLSRYY